MLIPENKVQRSDNSHDTFERPQECYDCRIVVLFEAFIEVQWPDLRLNSGHHSKYRHANDQNVVVVGQEEKAIPDC